MEKSKLHLFTLSVIVTITMLLSSSCGSGGGGENPKPSPNPDPQRVVPDNTNGLISGRVVNFYTGEPISGAKVNIEGKSFSDYTDQNGIFVLKDIPPDEEEIVTIQARGFANNQKIITVPPKTSVPVDVKLKPVTLRKRISLQKGIKVAYKSAGEDSIKLTTPDQSLQVKLSLNELTNTLYKSLAAGATNDEVFMELTTGDPTLERDIFPGDFRAVDHKVSTGQTVQKALYQAGDLPNVTLESVAFAEITLRDDAGNEIQLPTGTSMDIRMRVPDNLQEVYRDFYYSGERFVPWYSYDESGGLWKREGEAHLLIVDEDGDGVEETVYAEGVATHFSWWNLDWPISTHSCITGSVLDKEHNPLAGATVIAEGIDYQGRSSPQATNATGSYTVRVKRGSVVRLWSELGSIKGGVYMINVPDVGLPPELGGEPGGSCTRQDLILATYQVRGRVVDQNSKALKGVYVYGDTGISTMTGDDGQFSVNVPPNQTVKFNFSYSASTLTYSATREVNIDEGDMDIGDIVINTSTINVTGRVFLKKIDGTTALLSDALVFTDNGQKGETDVSGEYRVLAVKPLSDNIQNLLLRFSFYSVEIGYLTTETLCPLKTTDTRCNDVTLSEDAIFIRGKVTDDVGNPHKSVIVYTQSLATNTNELGEYSIKARANSQIILTAAYRDVCDSQEQSRTITTGFADMDGEDFIMNIEPAWVAGKVTYKNVGTPVQGVEVLTIECGAKTVTDSEGQYRIKSPPNRDMTLRFTPPNGKREEGAIKSAGRGTEVVLNMEVDSRAPEIRKMIPTPNTVDLSCNDRSSIPVNIYDPDTSNIGYSITATGGSFLGTTSGTVANATTPTGTDLSFIWTAPPQQGDYTVTLVANDGTGSIDSESRSIQVRDKINKDPVILAMGATSALVKPGDSTRVWVSAYDPEGGGLQYNWDIPAGWGATATNAVTLIIPQGTSDGDYTINVSVTDGCNANASAFITINVKTPPVIIVNNFPVINSLNIQPAPPVKGGRFVTLSVDASDPDGDPLTYEWWQGGNRLSTNSSYIWTSPIVTVTTVYTFTAKVADNSGAYSIRDVDIEVSPNIPPTVNLSADRTAVYFNEVVNLTVAATDTESDPLTYTWSATGGTISGDGTGVAWQSPSEPGNYTITITVSDGINPVDASITINVSEPGNNSPAVSLTADMTSANPGETVNLTATASDPDSDLLTYVWSSTGGTISANGAQSVWTSPDTCGTYTITIHVTDGRGGADTDSIVVQVSGCPGVTISGYARDSIGNPVSSALVEIYDSYDRSRFDMQTVTDIAGYYEFLDVPSGTYYVVVARDGYTLQSRQIIVP